MDKLIKAQLTIEREDGSRVLKTVEGEHAERWQQIVEGHLMQQQARMGRADSRFEGIEWREEPIMPKVIEIQPHHILDNTPTPAKRFPSGEDVTNVHVARHPEYEAAEEGDTLRLVGRGLQCKVLTKRMDANIIFFEATEAGPIRY